MKSVSIICEYNPLHAGHMRHIAETRALLQSDEEYAVVCVMSGNFVQRGEPAVFDKHTRAGKAVQGGADLVIELPSPYALQSAGGFARAGVELAAALGCEYLSFGSESGDMDSLRKIADSADEQSPAEEKLLRSPNNLLGVEYLRAISELGCEIIPLTVRRPIDSERSSAIRETLRLSQSAENVGVFMENNDLAILSRLRMLPELAFDDLPGADGGLGDRLRKTVRREASVEAILIKTKTKRYTMARVKRMLMCACLGITQSDTAQPVPYIRVLAMNKRGQAFLKTASHKTALPVITKPAAAKKLGGRAAVLFQKESDATDFYTLLRADTAKRRGGLEWTKSPVVI